MAELNRLDPATQPNSPPRPSSAARRCPGQVWKSPLSAEAGFAAYFCLSASRTATMRSGSAASGGMPARSTCRSWPTVLLRVPQPRFIASVNSSSAMLARRIGTPTSRPRSCAADRADRRRRPDRGRGGSDPLRDRPHLECRRAVRAPETISARGRFEDVHRGGYDPEQHLKDMALDGVAAQVLYPSQGLFYFKGADALLMSAIFRAYNDWLADFYRTDPARLKGIAMINLAYARTGLFVLRHALQDLRQDLTRLGKVDSLC